MDDAVRDIGYGRYDWTVFTSGNAVDGMLRRVDCLGLSPVVFAATRVAAVGNATAARLRAAGIEVALLPERFDGEAVRDALARDVVIEGLRAAGAVVETVEAYRTEPEMTLDPAIIEAIERGEFDVATFASSSCVRALAALLPRGLDSLRESAVACLGPVTAETAREYGLRVDIVAADATIPGLIRALIDGRDRIDAVRAERSRTLVGAGAGGER
jgi:uroporphyrinogen-III synthase